MSNEDDVTSSWLFNDIKPHYSMHNGLRHVAPYEFNYRTYCKKRWLNRTLLDVFVTEFLDMSSEYYRNAIVHGKIRINGALAKPDYILKDNDLITHVVERAEPPVTSSTITKIYEDEDLLVVDKPSPLPVHPSGRYRFNTLIGILMTTFGYRKLSLINRLDKSVSGLVIMAKNDSSARIHHAMMASGRLQKQYLCRVKGYFPDGLLRCDAPIKLWDHKLCLSVPSPEGKPCVTIFERLWSNNNESIVRAQPLTGRSHQIRVHLRYLGFPVIGDSLYGDDVWRQSASPMVMPSAEAIAAVKSSILHRKAVSGAFKCCSECSKNNYTADVIENIRLHAYSYSSPNWAFRSKLPDWAKYLI
jgi:tRNA pseudouridine synthase 9